MQTTLLVLLLTCAATAQAAGEGCELNPDVSSAIAEVEDLRHRSASDEFRMKARSIMRAAVRQYPEDVFANIHYLRLYREKGHDDVVAAYRSAMQAHQSDRRYALFYAASLIGNDTAEALRRLTELASPDFPYPYLLIAQIRSYPKFHNKAELSTSLIQFVTACPSYLPAYELLAFAGSGEELRTIGQRLRVLLTGRSDREAVAAFRSLWALEFRTAPPAEHGALRLRVEEDIAASGLASKVDDPVAAETLRAGFRLSGNTAALNAIPPFVREPMYEAERQWAKEHPRPGQNASDEEQRTYYRALLQATAAWVNTWPTEPMPWMQRFRAISKLRDTSEAEIVAAGEQLIAVNRKRPGRYLRVPAVIDVARAYVERGIRLDAVPRMIEAGLQEAEQTRPYPESDLSDDRNHRLNEESRYAAWIEAHSVRFEWSIKTSGLQSARDALRAIRDAADRWLAVAIQPGWAQFVQAEYWRKMARLAELEGRTEDAAEYQRTAKNASSPAARVENTRESSRAEGKRLPSFTAAAIDGRVWATSDLEGKVTFMSIWATWCRPCVEELPYLQKLYEALKGRPNVLFLSLSVDANPGVVEPFLKGRGLTFPVIPAYDYINGILPEMSIPRNWIVESGIIRSEDVGFDKAETWLERMLAKVEAAQRLR